MTKVGVEGRAMERNTEMFKIPENKSLKLVTLSLQKGFTAE